VVLLAVFLTAQGGKTAPETDKYPMEKAQATDEKHTGWEGILGDSAEVRIQYWKASWEVFREHSILGVGPGNFADSYLAHRTPRGSETRYAHNDYVEVTVEQGLAGLVAYLAMWAIWFWCMRRDATKREEEKGKAETEAEDRRSRRGFALLIGAVGVAGVLFTMNQFIPTGETWMMILVGIAAWVGVYWVQARRAVDAPEELNLRLARGAILIGVCAFLIHSAIDFDFDVPGVMMPLAGMLAVGIALRQKTGETKVRTFGTRGQLTLTALVAAPLGLILIFILYPLIDMSVALEEAQKLVENQNLTVQMAMDARKRGDDKTFEEYMTRAQRIADVEIPARYRSAIEAYPGNAEPYVELARLEAAPLYDDPTSDRSKVERLLDDAKRLRPCDPTPWVMLAEMLSAQIAAAEEKGRADLIPALAQAGLTESEGAIKRYPAQPRLRLIRARLLGRLTRPAEAIKEYETALFLAEETSEKELKFTPEVVKGIEESMEKLKAKE